MFGTVCRCASAIITICGTLLLALVLLIGKAAGGSGSIAYVSNRDGSRNIYLMDLDNGFTRQLTSGYDSNIQPAFSPDGRFIAYTSYRDNHAKLYMMRSSGTQQRELPVPFANVLNPDGPQYGMNAPVFSPDGRWLAYMSTANGNRDIYVVPAECLHTGQCCQPYQITDSSANDQYPSWSPDGRWLAFESNRDGRMDIYLMDTACLDQPETCPSHIRCLHTVGYSHMGVSWSPSGAEVVFASSARAHPSLEWDLLVQPIHCDNDGEACPPDTTSAIVAHYTHCAHPAWSSDGRYIVYEVWAGNWDLYLVEARCADPNITCGPPQRITHSDWDNRSAVFLP